MNNELKFDELYRLQLAFYYFTRPKVENVVKAFGDDDFYIQGALCDNEFVVRLSDYSNVKEVENFLPKIKKYYQSEWFTNQTASWNVNFKPVFTEVLTKLGYGFAFNMLPHSKMFTER